MKTRLALRAEALRQADCDLVVTVGGASVGDHDLVRAAGEALGLSLRVASVAVSRVEDLAAAHLMAHKQQVLQQQTSARARLQQRLETRAGGGGGACAQPITARRARSRAVGCSPESAVAIAT